MGFIRAFSYIHTSFIFHNNPLFLYNPFSTLIWFQHLVTQWVPTEDLRWGIVPRNMGSPPVVTALKKTLLSPSAPLSPQRYSGVGVNTSPLLLLPSYRFLQASLVPLLHTEGCPQAQPCMDVLPLITPAVDQGCNIKSWREHTSPHLPPSLILFLPQLPQCPAVVLRGRDTKVLLMVEHPKWPSLWLQMSHVITIAHFRKELFWPKATTALI